MSNKAKKVRNFAALSGGALVVASPFVAAGTAEAGATFTVTSLLDDGTGLTLREAIGLANADSTADTIQFQSGLNGTITLTGGRLDINESVTITGPGSSALTIDGNGAGIFYVYSNPRTIDVTISGTTVTGGHNTLYGGGGLVVWGEHVTLRDTVFTGNDAIDNGGAILLSGGSAAEIDDLHFEMYDSKVTGNSADMGGGIALYNTSESDDVVVHIERSTISGNTATGAAGGFLMEIITAPVEIVDSTISGNTADAGGGGIYLTLGSSGAFTMTNSTLSENSAPAGGGMVVFGYGDVHLEHSTISGNTATELAPKGSGSLGEAKVSSTGGGILLSYASLDFDHTVVSANTAVTGSDVAQFITGSLTGNYSMIGDLDGLVLAGTTNLPEGDAKLGPLADNGGPTKTHLPLAGSPLIDAGDPAFVAPPSKDQRGLARVSNGRIDVGAVEVQPAVLPPTGGSNGLMATLGAGLLALGGALHLTGRRKRTA